MKKIFIDGSVKLYGKRSRDLEIFCFSDDLYQFEELFIDSFDEDGWEFWIETEESISDRPSTCNPQH